MHVTTPSCVHYPGLGMPWLKSASSFADKVWVGGKMRPEKRNASSMAGRGDDVLADGNVKGCINILQVCW